MTTPTTVLVQLKLRSDTAANWTSANPTLLSGELGRETDTGKIKIGNGSTAWTALAYQPFGAPITNADISATAEIAVSKLADGAARQLLQTDAAGTGVEWASNVDIPGTLDVTGAATFDAAVTIAGDLTVNGTTTNINTTNLVVEDKNIILGDVTTPSDITADGGGITLKGATDKTINWVDATDAWTSSERFSYPLGSVTAPALTFTGDPNTGIYSPGADQVAISTDGVQRINIEADGDINIDSGGVFYDATNNRLAIGTTSPYSPLTVRGLGNNITLDLNSTTTNDYSAIVWNGSTVDVTANSTCEIRGYRVASAAGELGFHTRTVGGSSQERARIDSSGRLLVGTATTPPAIETLTPGLVRSGVGSTVDEYSAGLYCYRNAGGSGRQTVAPRFFFARSRSAVNNATGGVVLDGDDLGNIRFAGDDGTNFITAAEILVEVDGTPGTNDMPGRLVFSTTADGASSPTERVRISANGLSTFGSQAATGAALSVTAPAKLYVASGAYTDNTTAASGTVTHGTIAAFDNPGIAATNASVTYTNASTVYIDGAPTASTNVTVTNPYALYVNAGTSFFGGNVNLSTGNEYRINNTKVVGARVTGWTAATGTATRTAFATSTVTTAQLAERVKALIDDLISHGLIGT